MRERIEGIPIGTKIVKISNSVALGDYYIYAVGNKPLQAETPFTAAAMVILEPDNVYNVMDLSGVTPPAGYTRDGNKPEEYFRFARRGEIYLTKDWDVTTLVNAESTACKYIIVRKVTKSVLVWHQEWIVDDTNSAQGYISTHSAQESVRQAPHIYRIEERPI